MEITGRVTADAEVFTTKQNKQVVNFNVAVNRTYKNGEGERVRQTAYYRCAYWMAPAIAGHIKKGMVLQLSGWVTANAWTDNQGEARASLNFHTDNIQFHSGGTAPAVASGPDAVTAHDDLPF